MGRQLPCQLGQDAWYAYRQLGIDGDNRLKSRAGFTQVGVMVRIQYRLVIHSRVHRGHRPCFYADNSIQYKEYGTQGISGTGCGGYDSVLCRQH
jgi:hypothetical protein